MCSVGFRQTSQSSIFLSSSCQFIAKNLTEPQQMYRSGLPKLIRASLWFWKLGEDSSGADGDRFFSSHWPERVNGKTPCCCASSALPGARSFLHDPDT